MRLVTTLALSALFVAAAPLAFAAESVDEDQTAAETAEQPPGVFQKAFQRRIREKTLFPRLKEYLKDKPAFLSDAQVSYRFRSYYFYRDDHIGDSKREAGAYGGGLVLRSGWLEDTFQVGGTYYTSQPAYKPEDRPGSGLLEEQPDGDQEGYSAWGELFAAARYKDHELKYYRQELSLPYVNSQDIRMTPITHQGLTLFHRTGKLRYAAGHLTDIKGRNSPDFISYGEKAGAPGHDAGLTFAGVVVEPVQGFTIGAVNHYVDDIINIFYTESTYAHPLTDELELRLAAQYTDQRSTGHDRLTGTSYDTGVGGARASLRYRGAEATVAFSTVDAEADIINPFGSYPGYCSLMVRDFYRADEDTWCAGVSYDFERVGVPGLSAFTNVARGTDATDPATGAHRENSLEIDLTVDYRLQREGFMKGLWLRVRGARVEEENVLGDFRAILNYEFPLL
jgi:hypothetical protein